MQEPQVITVTLNPAVDRVIDAPGLTLGDHQTVRTLSRTPGGKGVNVSRALAAMGLDSLATGFLGVENETDFTPLFADGLVRDGFLTIPGRTRENITITDPQTQTDTHLRDAGFAIEPAWLAEMREQLTAVIEKRDWAIFSGSLPEGVGPDDFANLLDAAIDAGANVVADTSGEALAAIRRKSLTLLKVNAEELAELTGAVADDRSAQLKAARGLAQRYGGVLLSAGSEGAWLIRRENTFFAAAPSVAVVNTVGCGDTLLAGVLAGLLDERPDDEALALGVAMAAASAETPEPGQFAPERVETLLQEIQVRSDVE